MHITELPGPDWDSYLVPVDELHVDGENPNEMSVEMFDRLISSINRLGWVVPILADEDGLISDGEHRLRAANELELESVPVVGEDLAEVERRLARLEMNLIQGEHEPEQQALEVEYLLDNDMGDEIIATLDASDRDLDDVLDETPDLSEEIPDFDPVDEDEQPRLDELDTDPVTCPECFHEFKPE